MQLRENWELFITGIAFWALGAVIGMVWSGLVWGSRPDQTSYLHNNRSGRTGPTNKTAKNEAEIVPRMKGNIFYYYPLILSLSFSLSSLSLSSSTWSFPYQARRHSQASIISAFSLPRRSTIVSFPLLKRRSHS